MESEDKVKMMALVAITLNVIIGLVGLGVDQAYKYQTQQACFKAAGNNVEAIKECKK